MKDQFQVAADFFAKRIKRKSVPAALILKAYQDNPDALIKRYRCVQTDRYAQIFYSLCAVAFFTGPSKIAGWYYNVGLIEDYPPDKTFSLSLCVSFAFAYATALKIYSNHTIKEDVRSQAEQCVDPEFHGVYMKAANYFSDRISRLRSDTFDDSLIAAVYKNDRDALIQLHRDSSSDEWAARVLYALGIAALLIGSYKNLPVDLGKFSNISFPFHRAFGPSLFKLSVWIGASALSMAAAYALKKGVRNAARSVEDKVIKAGTLSQNPSLEANHS
ncbi:MAG: hypothetical protein L6Q57_09835 [Alphaproteobacteria bacterium]|nr:hypothetical protein [Alphaproteobacteria bacterium]